MKPNQNKTDDLAIEATRLVLCDPNLPDPPPTREIDRCDNFGCGGNDGGRCTPSGGEICFGYFEPKSQNH